MCARARARVQKDSRVNSTHDSDYLTADVTTGHLFKAPLSSVNLSAGLMDTKWNKACAARPCVSVHAHACVCVCVKGVYYSQCWDINLFTEVTARRHAVDKRPQEELLSGS